MTARHPERGITLTEITIVFVLASLVMTGLITFYFNSQAVWVDGSAQAISQREATLIVDAVTARARTAESASVEPSGQIDMVMDHTVPDSSVYFRLVGGHIHEGYQNLPVDRDLLLGSEVMCFSAHADSMMLHLDSLRVKSPSGSQVTMSTAASFRNR